MRDDLTRWVSDADAARHLENFGVSEPSLELSYIRERSDDYYIALVGELFEMMRGDSADSFEWARLGNALAQYAALDHQRNLRYHGISVLEANLFAAAAFYFGGFSASAYVVLKGQSFGSTDQVWRACYDLLARPEEIRSSTVQVLLHAIRTGNPTEVAQVGSSTARAEEEALPLGPNEWISARLLNALSIRFSQTNVRAVLPDGYSEFWSPMVASLLDRRPPAWEFFPSQIQAINAGLLERADTCSLQMPTGAGKTALTEILLYWHLNRNPTDVAILLVPYRSLASELRGTLIRQLNSLGISSRAAYGGTVPTGDEVRGLEQTRALVATPETLSGILGADHAFFQRISLVICDEGHLLDGPTRGIGLELLLARLKARETGPPRFVFVSAIVPNIEEINTWLAGDSDSGFVVRSDYRPALAEFAFLIPSGSGSAMVVGLRMHPQENADLQFLINSFLTREDFRFRNPLTGRLKTLTFTSVKTQSIAAARKALAMGAVAVFAANKRGNQGAVGLAEELLKQVVWPLSLPAPSDFVVEARLALVIEYLRQEFGPDWVGTRALEAGAVLHHGDIPQETREVVETLLRTGDVKFAICTSTLAEGVNLPIRTLVLYSVNRLQPSGEPQAMFARDIKNLVGRAGRAGATTKGLVICANPNQWPLVLPAARQDAGEPVHGALLSLVNRLQASLAVQNVTLNNQWLEAQADLHALIDGIDATLVDLAAEEIDEERLRELATEVVNETFAAQQANAASRAVLETVFRLRSERVSGIRTAGRLGWLRETGARLRMIDTVETELVPQREDWDDARDPVAESFVTTVLAWAWTQLALQESIRNAYRLKGNPSDIVRESFFKVVRLWLDGSSFHEMAVGSGLSVDDLLSVYTRAVAFELQTLVEQGIALLKKILEAEGKLLGSAVELFPEHLRFGVPTVSARVLSANGLRHRRASVALGTSNALRGNANDAKQVVFIEAQRVLFENETDYKVTLGTLVFNHTVSDLAALVGPYST